MANTSTAPAASPEAAKPNMEVLDFTRKSGVLIERYSVNQLVYIARLMKAKKQFEHLLRKPGTPSLRHHWGRPPKKAKTSGRPIQTTNVPSTAEPPSGEQQDQHLNSTNSDSEHELGTAQTQLHLRLGYDDAVSSTDLRTASVETGTVDFNNDADRTVSLKALESHETKTQTTFNVPLGSLKTSCASNFTRQEHADVTAVSRPLSDAVDDDHSNGMLLLRRIPLVDKNTDDSVGTKTSTKMIFRRASRMGTFPHGSGCGSSPLELMPSRTATSAARAPNDGASCSANSSTLSQSDRKVPTARPPAQQPVQRSESENEEWPTVETVVRSLVNSVLVEEEERSMRQRGLHSATCNPFASAGLQKYLQGNRDLKVTFLGLATPSLDAAMRPNKEVISIRATKDVLLRGHTGGSRLKKTVSTTTTHSSQSERAAIGTPPSNTERRPSELDCNTASVSRALPVASKISPAATGVDLDTAPHEVHTSPLKDSYLRHAHQPSVHLNDFDYGRDNPRRSTMHRVKIIPSAEVAITPANMGRTQSGPTDAVSDGEPPLLLHQDDARSTPAWSDEKVSRVFRQSLLIAERGARLTATRYKPDFRRLPLTVNSSVYAASAIATVDEISQKHERLRKVALSDYAVTTHHADLSDERATETDPSHHYHHLPTNPKCRKIEEANDQLNTPTIASHAETAQAQNSAPPLSKGSAMTRRGRKVKRNSRFSDYLIGERSLRKCEEEAERRARERNRRAELEYARQWDELGNQWASVTKKASPSAGLPGGVGQAQAGGLVQSEARTSTGSLESFSSSDGELLDHAADGGGGGGGVVVSDQRAMNNVNRRVPGGRVIQPFDNTSDELVVPDLLDSRRSAANEHGQCGGQERSGAVRYVSSNTIAPVTFCNSSPSKRHGHEKPDGETGETIRAQLTDFCDVSSTRTGFSAFTDSLTMRAPFTVNSAMHRDTLPLSSTPVQLPKSDARQRKVLIDPAMVDITDDEISALEELNNILYDNPAVVEADQLLRDFRSSFCIEVRNQLQLLRWKKLLKLRNAQLINELLDLAKDCPVAELKRRVLSNYTRFTPTVDTPHRDKAKVLPRRQRASANNKQMDQPQQQQQQQQQTQLLMAPEPQAASTNQGAKLGWNTSEKKLVMMFRSPQLGRFVSSGAPLEGAVNANGRPAFSTANAPGVEFLAAPSNKSAHQSPWAVACDDDATARIRQRGDITGRSSLGTAGLMTQTPPPPSLVVHPTSPQSPAAVPVPGPIVPVSPIIPASRLKLTMGQSSVKYSVSTQNNVAGNRIVFGKDLSAPAKAGGGVPGEPPVQLQAASAADGTTESKKLPVVATVVGSSAARPRIIKKFVRIKRRLTNGNPPGGAMTFLRKTAGGLIEFVRVVDRQQQQVPAVSGPTADAVTVSGKRLVSPVVPMHFVGKIMHDGSLKQLPQVRQVITSSEAADIVDRSGAEVIAATSSSNSSFVYPVGTPRPVQAVAFLQRQQQQQQQERQQQHSEQQLPATVVQSPPAKSILSISGGAMPVSVVTASNSSTQSSSSSASADAISAAAARPPVNEMRPPCARLLRVPGQLGSKPHAVKLVVPMSSQTQQQQQQQQPVPRNGVRFVTPTNAVSSFITTGQTITVLPMPVKVTTVAQHAATAAAAPAAPTAATVTAKLD